MKNTQTYRHIAVKRTRPSILGWLLLAPPAAWAQTFPLDPCSSVVFAEKFESGRLPVEMTGSKVGSFNSAPGIQSITNFGGTKAFGFGLSACGISCFGSFASTLAITLPAPTYVSELSFREMELYGNWGSEGVVTVDGVQLNQFDSSGFQNCGRPAVNDGTADTTFRTHHFVINGVVKTVALEVTDITDASEIYVADIGLTTVSLNAPAILTQPQGLTLTQGSNAIFTVSASSAVPISYQWTLDGTNLIGATNAILSIPNVSPAQAGDYQVSLASCSGSVKSDVAVLTVPGSLAATATATVVNDFVVEATITYGGSGYTNTPGVRIIGGGGSAAHAAAVVSNGVVIAVNILDTGDGYTNTPVVVIAPPFIPHPAMGVAAMSLLSFTNLAAGASYQLQSFFDGTLFNVGAPFNPAGSVFTQLVSGAAGPNSYPLAAIPVPEQASATAQVDNGFVVGATVTGGGWGYTTKPGVTIGGGAAGSNATAIAYVDGGSVTNITIISPGIGYTNGATIIIAPPPATALWPNNVTQVMQLDLGNLSPYDNYQLQFTPVVAGVWTNLGIPFTPTSVTNTQYINVTDNAGFFRAMHLP